MEAILERCCGLDVHKREVVACLLVGATHERPRRDVRRFATLTVSLRELRDWLVSAGCTHVAMESTGPYWRPVFNLLEGAVTVVLANARHIKNVPGRKTDVRDCEWIAQLLRCGLIRGSFIPPAAIRELRDLTRYRRQLVEEGTRARNRVQKLLEHANVKLGSVLSDVFGASGRAMLAALSAGPEPPEALARLARGRVRATQSELTQALDGVVGEHHRLLLRQMLAHLADLERRVAELDACIQGRLAPLAAAVARVQTIPGIKAVAAAAILAELGTDMSPFPTDAHLASWAGLCPGNHESAGKRKSGRTRPGNRWLRAAMTEAAWAAARTKSTALRAAYDRIARRRGRKRALLALAHRLLVVVYHLLNDGCTYTEFGAHYLDRRRHDAHTRYFLRRLRALGYEATLRPLDAPPPVAA